MKSFYIFAILLLITPHFCEGVSHKSRVRKTFLQQEMATDEAAAQSIFGDSGPSIFTAQTEPIMAEQEADKIENLSAGIQFKQEDEKIENLSAGIPFKQEDDKIENLSAEIQFKQVAQATTSLKTQTKAKTHSKTHAKTHAQTSAKTHHHAKAQVNTNRAEKSLATVQTNRVNKSVASVQTAVSRTNLDLGLQVIQKMKEHCGDNFWSCYDAIAAGRQPGQANVNLNAANPPAEEKNTATEVSQEKNPAAEVNQEKKNIAVEINAGNAKHFEDISKKLEVLSESNTKLLNGQRSKLDHLESQIRDEIPKIMHNVLSSYSQTVSQKMQAETKNLINRALSNVTTQVGQITRTEVKKQTQKVAEETGNRALEEYKTRLDAVTQQVQDILAQEMKENQKLQAIQRDAVVSSMNRDIETLKRSQLNKIRDVEQNSEQKITSHVESGSKEIMKVFDNVRNQIVSQHEELVRSASEKVDQVLEQKLNEAVARIGSMEREMAHKRAQQLRTEIRQEVHLQLAHLKNEILARRTPATTNAEVTHAVMKPENLVEPEKSLPEAEVEPKVETKPVMPASPVVVNPTPGTVGGPQMVEPVIRHVTNVNQAPKRELQNLQSESNKIEAEALDISRNALNTLEDVGL